MTCHESLDTGLGVQVDEMLLDAGAAGDAKLRVALLTLGSLADLPAPAPSGDLAKLMAAASQSTGSGDAPVHELARRRRQRNLHRPTLLGIALIAGMGTGIGGVAASSPAPGHAGSLSVQELLSGWSPSWSLPVQAPAPGMAAGPAATEVPGQPVQPAATAPLGPSTPLAGPSQADSIGRQPAPQQPAPQPPAAAQPAAAPELPAQAFPNNGVGAGGKGGPEAPGRDAGELPPATAGVAEPAMPEVPGGPRGTLTAEDGLTGSPVRPLAGVLHPVRGTSAPDNPAPLAGWLQKVQR